MRQRNRFSAAAVPSFNTDHIMRGFVRLEESVRRMEAPRHRTAIAKLAVEDEGRIPSMLKCMTGPLNTNNKDLIRRSEAERG